MSIWRSHERAERHGLPMRCWRKLKGMACPRKVEDGHDQMHRWVENRLDDYFGVFVFRKMVLFAELIL